MYQRHGSVFKSTSLFVENNAICYEGLDSTTVLSLLQQRGIYHMVPWQTSQSPNEIFSPQKTWPFYMTLLGWNSTNLGNMFRVELVYIFIYDDGDHRCIYIYIHLIHGCNVIHCDSYTPLKFTVIATWQPLAPMMFQATSFILDDEGSYRSWPSWSGAPKMLNPGVCTNFTGEFSVRILASDNPGG